MNLVLRGIKRVRAQGEQRLSRLPITATVLRKIKAALAQHPFVIPVNYGMGSLLYWFFGFLRCGEFLVPDGSTFDPSIHLSLADIAFTRGPELWGAVCVKIAVFCLVGISPPDMTYHSLICHIS